MKFLVIGAWQRSWYEEAISKALTALGHRVEGFSIAQFFFDGWHAEHVVKHRSLWTRFQNRLIWGPLVSRLNREFVEYALEFRPDVVLVYNGTHVLPAFLTKIKTALPNTILAQYCNDNPFSSSADWWLWRHLKRSVPIYDLHFAYREANRIHILESGGRSVHLLRSYYVPETDFRVELGEGDDAFASDLVFVGHFENDGRLEFIEAVAKLDLHFNLFGGTWFLAKRHLNPDSPLHRFFPIRALSRSDYRKAVSGAKIALCFLSKLNEDSYTRRNFEIPAMQAFMLSEYSDDLCSLFEPGREAEFFRSKEELLDKIAYYLKHDREREAIARNGYQRLLRDGHDVTSRARELLSVVDTIFERDQGTEATAMCQPTAPPEIEKGVLVN